MAIDIPAELRNLYPLFTVYNIGTGVGAAAIPATGNTPVTILAAMSTADQTALTALIQNPPGTGQLHGVMEAYLISPTVAINYSYSTTGALWPIAAGTAITTANRLPLISAQNLVFLVSNTASPITDAKVLFLMRNGA